MLRGRDHDNKSYPEVCKVGKIEYSIWHRQLGSGWFVLEIGRAEKCHEKGLMLEGGEKKDYRESMFLLIHTCHSHSH